MTNNKPNQSWAYCFMSSIKEEVVKEIKKYLYVINYPVYEADLCMMEMRTLFNDVPEDKVLISERKFNPSNSPFIKKRLEVIYEEDSFEEILKKLEEEEIRLEDFKAEYLRLETGNIPYEERLKTLREIGLRIIGFPSMTAPKIRLGITRHKEKWIFGICVNNDYKWKEHDNKPCTYSNSLGIRTAKAIVNIATMGKAETRVVDACCGVGTTLIEGLSAGYDICGYELSPKTTANAKENLRYFKLEERVVNQDMNKIEEEYDSCIIDIPYGLFSHTTKELQQEMIDTARRISKRMIMVTFEDIDRLILNAGFKIVERCSVGKGNFIRDVLICE